MSDSLQPYGLYPTRLFCPWDFIDKNTGVGWHFILQGIFLTQGLNMSLASPALVSGFFTTTTTKEFFTTTSTTCKWEKNALPVIKIYFENVVK